MKFIYRVLLRLSAVMALVGAVVIALNVGDGNDPWVTAAIFGVPVLGVLALAWIFKPRDG